MRFSKKNKMFSFADKVFVELYEEFNIKNTLNKFRVNDKYRLEVYDKDDSSWREAGQFVMALLTTFPEYIEIVRKKEKNNEELKKMAN